MNRQYRNINGKSSKAKEKLARRNFEDDMEIKSEDSLLLGSINEYMMGRLDLEEVRNDPALPGMESVVKEMISDYNINRANSKNNKNFIRDIFAGDISDEKLLNEIGNIKYEINTTNVNDISAEWVKEWHSRKQKNLAPDPKAAEIKSFISGSLETEIKEVGKIKTEERRKGLTRSLMVRYISVAAAAVLGIFILVKTLIPSSDTDTLFNSFYAPLNTVSSVTRGVNNGESNSYASAIESYKLGYYKAAATGLSSEILSYPNLIAPRFFMGITQLALGNYDQAINFLSDVSANSVDYGKEARWYLGLAYLKKGEKEKASACFGPLAKSPGYYSKRSEKILRRLK